MNKHIQDILDNFKSIDLKTLENNYSLLDRLDYKYLLNIRYLFPFLTELLKNEYKILEIKNNRIFTYKNLYFDTLDHQMYLFHHNGKTNRFKIRIREYIETSQMYLEIKQKYSNGRCIKYRKKINKFEDNSMINNFIENYSPYKIKELNKTLYNQFHRITLVNDYNIHRVTIDFNLKFKNNEFVYLPEIAIIEVKIPKELNYYFDRNIIKKFSLKQCNFSKYCIGIALTKNNIKKNNFKATILMINKIKNLN